jgi:Na+/alanine symporter
VWHFVDAVITFMTIPNLIAVLLLTPVLMKETRHYLGVVKRLRKGHKVDE